MARGRSLRPAATVARAPAGLALRLLIASIPLVPWAAARADVTVPAPEKKPVEPIVARIAPPPPGVMPPPHLPERPRPPTEKKK